jgi:hypothetical protein
MASQEKYPIVIQEPAGGTLGDGLATIIEDYQDKEESPTHEAGKMDYGINNIQGSPTL